MHKAWIGLMLTMSLAHAGERAIPPLNLPPWPVKRVASLAELKNALGTPNQILVLAPGLHAFGEEILVRDVRNLVIAGGDADASKTILRGPGWVGTHGSGPHFTVSTAHGITFANLTFEETRTYAIKVSGESDPSEIHIYNCRFKNIGVRAIKGSGSDRGVAKGGSVRHCRFACDRVPPKDWLFDGNYISAIDMMRLDGWTFADNEFREVKGLSGEGRGAIFLWVDCKRCTIERNFISGCDRGIAIGNPAIDDKAKAAGMLHADDFTVRNNAIVTATDAGIEIAWARNIRVQHNTIFRTADAAEGRGIRAVKESRLEKIELVNNLVHGTLWDAPGVEQRRNLFGKLDGYFVAPASGDLHLTPLAVKAIHQAEPLSDVKEDFDGLARDGAPDLGAFEFGARPAAPASTAVTASANGSSASTSRPAPKPDAPAAPKAVAVPADWIAKTKTRTLAAVAAGARPKVFLTLFGSKPEAVRLKAADDKKLTLDLKGSAMPWEWSQLKEPDYRQLAAATLGDPDAEGNLLLGVFFHCAGEAAAADRHFAQAILQDAKITRAQVDEIVKGLSAK